MFSNAKLRLLLSLLKFERLGQENVEGSSWIVPSNLKSTELRDMKAIIDKGLVIGVTDDRDPNDMLRRKHGNDPRRAGDQTTIDVHFGSESEGEDIVPDGPLFPPNPRSKANALKELKKKRKSKQKDDSEKEPLDDATLEERRRARLENTRARLAKIKSDLFVHASDEESDEEANQEFFRLEEERRKEQSERIKKALLLGRGEEPAGPPKKKRGKRASESNPAGEDETGGKRQRRASTELADDDILMSGADTPSRASSSGDSFPDINGADKGTSATPAEEDPFFDDDLAFTRGPSGEGALSSPKSQTGIGAIAEDDDDEPMAAPSRRRMRAGFVIDSDSE